MAKKIKKRKELKVQVPQAEVPKGLGTSETKKQPPAQTEPKTEQEKLPETSEEQGQPTAQINPETSSEEEKPPSQEADDEKISDAPLPEPPLEQHIRIEGFNKPVRQITYECYHCLQGMFTECSNKGKLQDVNIECPNCGKTAIKLLSVGKVQSTVAIDSPWQWFRWKVSGMPGVNNP